MANRWSGGSDFGNITNAVLSSAGRLTFEYDYAGSQDNKGSFAGTLDGDSVKDAAWKDTYGGDYYIGTTDMRVVSRVGNHIVLSGKWKETKARSRLRDWEAEFDFDES
jgi:hypothetical protein